jgi:tRNA(fMet)-specific endonuclease VapC
VSSVVLVDTNVLSYIFNQHSLGIPYKARLQGHILLVAAQTLEELHYGAFKANWGANRLQSLANFLESFTVVHTTPEICIHCARIRVETNKKGLVLDLPDAWIAATALALAIPLVTHNQKHFNFLEGLVLISEN